MPIRAAQAGELLPQAGAALIGTAVAPELVLEPGPGPLQLRRYHEQGEEPLPLAALGGDLDSVAPQQAHPSEEPQLQFAFDFSVLDHSALPGAEVTDEATCKQALGPAPIFSRPR